MAQRSLAKALWYNLLHTLSRLTSVLLLGMRVRGRERVPSSGGLLVCANHQSHFDPVLVGLAVDRRLNYLARDTLFGLTPFRWLIQSLDAIPIDREGMGLSGIKETLRRLKRGEAVLIFPEGTRTSDGAVAPLKPGFIALARRGRVPLLPVGIDGAFDAWPRTQLLPRLQMIHVVIGEAMTQDLVERLRDEEVLAELGRRLQECQAQAAAGRQQAKRTLPRRCVPGPAEPGSQPAGPTSLPARTAVTENRWTRPCLEIQPHPAKTLYLRKA